VTILQVTGWPVSQAQLSSRAVYYHWSPDLWFLYIIHHGPWFMGVWL